MSDALVMGSAWTLGSPSTVKGLLFVACTAVALGLTVRYYLRREIAALQRAAVDRERNLR
ncbi:MAG: hypothetical protein U1F10_05540 [Burkholderiales bacterium]